jgi:hypothetical protein
MGYGNYPTGLSSLEYASKIAFKLLYPAEKYLSNAKYPRCGGYSGGLGTVAKIGDWGLLGEENWRVKQGSSVAVPMHSRQN